MPGALYSDQLVRIKTKVLLAKEKDVNRKTFGADSHQYELGKPLSSEEVFRFEESQGIDLPESYKEFILTIGNGGPGYYGGAGPNYGIYPLGDFGYMESTAQYMADECIINSTLTEKQWKLLTAFDEKLDPDSLEYENTYNKLFSGLMFIGTMGCNGQMMIALNGKDTGCVVYIDQDLSQPAVKENFLDWYEKWLDTIIMK